jgi:hypothetical protein
LFKYEGLVIVGVLDAVGVNMDMDVDLVVAGNCPLTESTRELKKVTAWKTEHAIDGCLMIIMVFRCSEFLVVGIEITSQSNGAKTALHGVFQVLQVQLPTLYEQVQPQTSQPQGLGLKSKHVCCLSSLHVHHPDSFFGRLRKPKNARTGQSGELYQIQVLPDSADRCDLWLAVVAAIARQIYGSSFA